MNVTLQQILRARDARAERQQTLLSGLGRPLLSFCMNIPGPVKDSPLIRRCFRTGLSALREWELPLLSWDERYEPTGPELLCAVDMDARTLKNICLSLEDGAPVGRLFDMDVIDSDGKRLSRDEARPCLVCGAPGRGCASRRLHPPEQLQAAVKTLMEEHFLWHDRERVEALVTRALTDELETTPKPGLVDRSNNGSHRDMDRETFAASIRALRLFWGRCFFIGAATAGDPPAESFRLLRQEGLEAERTMLAATDGVNTHKGAVFLLGAVCGATGRLWSAEEPCRDPERIAAECAAMSREAIEADFAALRASGSGRSAGEDIYLRLGLRGARGELADGLPSVLCCALPALQSLLSAGHSRNDAGVAVLLRLIARGGDTNMIRRGGPETAAAAAQEAAALIARREQPDPSDVEALDRSFIARNLSPGGCADLLSVSFFLHDWALPEP